MPSYLFDIVALVLLVPTLAWVVILYRRVARLTEVLGQADELIGAITTASARLDASAEGFSEKITGEVAGVDEKVARVQRLADGLVSATRNAEEMSVRLEEALRQTRRLQTVRTPPPPRDAIEPKGFVERRAEKVAEITSNQSAPPLAAAALAFAPRIGHVTPAPLAAAEAYKERLLKVRIS